MGAIPLKKVFILLMILGVAACSPAGKPTATTAATGTQQTAGIAVSGQTPASPGQSASAPTGPTQTTAAQTASPQMTPNQAAETGATVTAAVTPPAGAAPMIKISDQVVGAGTVMVDQVVSSGPGWVVIYTTKTNGQPDQPIGHAAVKDGVNSGVMVQVDPNQAKGTLYAQLHADSGVVGDFEFPGPDQPVMVGVQMIGSAFKVLDAQAGKSSPTQVTNQVMVALGSQPATQSVLVDGNGMSLYVSLHDTPGKSNCDAQCQTIWRPLLATGRIVTGSGINPQNMGVILLPNGGRQVSYLGEPLYLFSQDEKPGDVNGQGYDGAWYLVIP